MFRSVKFWICVSPQSFSHIATYTRIMLTAAVLSLFVAITNALPDMATSVMVCRGEFPARRSACDDLPPTVSDMVPMQRMTCSKAISPSVWAAVLNGQARPGFAPSAFKFESGAAVAASLETIIIGNSNVYVSFGDCNSKSQIPALAKDTQYAAVILLDNKTAQQSVNLNSATRDSASRIEMKSTIFFYENGLLANEDFRKILASNYRDCAGSTSYCSLPFNSQSLAYTGTFILESY